MVSIASADRNAVAEAERQVKLILDPPTPEMGETYQGRVVNITNFGAFVNIMPGRDGLVHISKIGGKRRIDKVEDELSLGDTIEVIVEDIDPNGKISLMPAEFADELQGGGDKDSSDNGSGDRGGRSRDSGGGRDRDSGGGRDRGSRGGRDRDSGGGRSERGGRDRDSGGGRSERGGRDRDSGGGRGDRPKKAAGDVEVVSFNEAFDAEQSDRYKD